MKDMEILALSDVHLASGDPGGLDRFLSFLDLLEARPAAACYVLGDLFDYWVPRRGRIPPSWEPLASSFRRLGRRGIAVFFLHGNRDFLLGPRDARALGGRLAGEGCPLVSGDRTFYLTHGDRFCTRDHAYQRLRRILRNPVTKALARGGPSGLLERIARGLRRRSRAAVSRKAPGVTALDYNAVEGFLERGYDGIVCGHVHEKRFHVFPSGKMLVVLPNWGEGRGGYASIRAGRITLHDFPGHGSF